MSRRRVTLAGVQVTAADIERIPQGNLQVPRAEFAAVWAEAELHTGDWYGAGVVMVCRWVATAAVRPSTGPWRLAESPVTERTERAYEELIEAELLAAEVLSLRRPPPAWLAGRPGWLDGVLVALQWCWRGSRRLPFDIDVQATG
jgi:hypothetical protein